MLQKKICLLGSFAVGKTSLISRFVHGIFSEKYLTSIGVKIDSKILAVNEQQVRLMVWDLHGDDDYQKLKPEYLRGTAAYFLVVDGTRPSTLERALALQNRFQGELTGVPCVVLLNKNDLKPSWDLDPEVFAALENQYETRETSAKTGEGVEAAFLRLAELILEL